MRTGEVIDGKVLTRLPTVPAGLGQFEMNDDGVLWIGTFPSRATAVIFSSIRHENKDTHDRDLDDRR